MILRINDRFKNRKVDFFTDFRLNLKYDSVGSTFALGYYFDPDNPEHKEFSCIGHYHLCSLEDNGKTILTGIILSNRFKDSAKKELAVVSGYSTPGILDDCHIPPDLGYQYNKLSLREIAEKLTYPFTKDTGLRVAIDPIVRDEMEEVFDETDVKESQTVRSFLAELASQKNIILTHNTKGNLLFTRASQTKAPIFDFKEGMPGVSYELEFNGQGIHSDITSFAQADIDEVEQAQVATVKNPYCPIIYRPFTVVQNSKAVDADIERGAKNTRQQELKNISLTINLDRWDLNGRVMQPGDLITITNKRIYLYTKSTWLIDSIDLSGDAKVKTSVLKCVRPEVYTGEEPVYLWRGINTHYNG